MRGINHHDDWGWANAPRKGSSGGGSNTVTQTSNTLPPPEFSAGLSTALQQGQAAASQPFTNYPGQLQAGFSPQQMEGFGLVDSTPGLAAPYINAASQHFDAATTPLWQGLPQFSPEAIAQYSNPYTRNVIDATQNQFNNQNAIAANRLQGDAASKGALGGDRAGVAQAVLRGQEEFSQAPVIAGLQSQNYQQALAEFNQQQQQKLTSDTANAWLNNQAGSGFGALGKEALDTTLSSAGALIGAGNQQQAQAQQGLNIPYQQFLQQQGYPFQTSAWLSGLSAQLANAAGGTASTSAPGPSPVSQGLGAGIGLAGAAGSLFGKNGAFPGALNNLFGSSSAPAFDGGFSSAADSAAAAQAFGIGDPSATFAHGGAIHRAPGGSVPSLGDDPFLSSLGAGGLGDVMEPGGFGVPLGGGTRDANGGATMNLNPDVSVSVVGPPPNPGQPSQAKQSTTTSSGGGGGGGLGQEVGTAAGLVNIGRGIASLIALLNRGGAVPHRAPGGPVTVTSRVSPRTGFLLPMISVDSGSGAGTADAINAFLATQKAGAFVPPQGPQPFPGQIGFAAPSTGLVPPGFGGLGNGVIDQSFVGGGAGGNSEGGGGPGGPGGPSGGAGQGNDLGATDSVGGASGAGNSQDVSAGGAGDTTGGPDHEARGGQVRHHGFGLPHRAEGGGLDDLMLGQMPGFGRPPNGLPRAPLPSWAPSVMPDGPPDLPPIFRQVSPAELRRMAQVRASGQPYGPPEYPPFPSGGQSNAARDPYDTGLSVPPVPDITSTRAAEGKPSATSYNGPASTRVAEGKPPTSGYSGSGPPPAPPAPIEPAPDAPAAPVVAADTGLGAAPGKADTYSKPHSADPWLALAEAGFAMAAGRSPYAMQNIGAGAVAGIRAFRSDQREAEALATKVEDARARLAETHAWHSNTNDTRRYGIETRADTARMVNDRVNYWRQQGFDTPTAYQRAQIDIAKQRVAQGDDRLNLGWETLHQHGADAAINQELRRQAMDQARTTAEQQRLSTASNAQIAAAARMSLTPGQFHQSLEQVMKGRLETTQTPAAPASTAPAQGSGTQANPYHVTTPQQAAALPSGAYFTNPAGELRQRP